MGAVPTLGEAVEMGHKVATSFEDPHVGLEKAAAEDGELIVRFLGGSVCVGCPPGTGLCPHMEPHDAVASMMVGQMLLIIAGRIEDSVAKMIRRLVEGVMNFCV